MKLVCDTCGRPAMGATTFHGPDGLVRVECDECHLRRISPPLPPKVQRIAVALWLILLLFPTAWLLGRFSSR